MPETPTPPPKQPDLLKSLNNLTDATPSAATSVTDDASEKADAIEMIGEEEAAKVPDVNKPNEISAGMRYLHCSRTINQLVADRNRAVGIFLAVASLLWTASSALLNAKPSGPLLVSIESLQRWCIPVTLGVLTLFALFTGLLLIRTRIGLIYEVAKMNALLGISAERVKRVNVFSIFFLMHLMISLAGAGCAGLFVLHLLAAAGIDGAGWLSTIAGLFVGTGLILTYVLTIQATTSDKRLQSAAK